MAGFFLCAVPMERAGRFQEVRRKNMNHSSNVLYVSAWKKRDTALDILATYSVDVYAVTLTSLLTTMNVMTNLHLDLIMNMTRMYGLTPTMLEALDSIQE
jgi:hypothetical protein